MVMLNKFRGLGAALSCVVFAAALAACGDGTKLLDGSSEQALQKSAQKVMESLPEDKKRAFGEAMHVIMNAGVGELPAAALNQGTVEALKEVQKRARERLDGKTADEAIALAEELKKKVSMQ
ncbi:MAG: hypothetical protein LBF50_05195 [Azoarcus sp.]|jgi:hypothetical protein|nr:hypothetical protein [Azoarcus sp.]